MGEENTLFRCIQKEENYKYVPFWKTFSPSKIYIYFKIKHYASQNGKLSKIGV